MDEYPSTASESAPSKKLKPQLKAGSSSQKANTTMKRKLSNNGLSNKKKSVKSSDLSFKSEDTEYSIFSRKGQNCIASPNRDLSVLNEQSQISNSIPQASNEVQSYKPEDTGASIFKTPTKSTRDFSRKKTSSVRKRVSLSPKDEVGVKKKTSPEKPKAGVSLPPEILNNLEHEIDEVLEEKAWKNNLSTVNVKNILRHVITNEHVLSMVRNTMREEKSCAEKQSGEDAMYEPKLTRSKAKELIQKQENVPWPISPIKKPHAVSCKFSERQFSDHESSSDEEYDPTREIEEEEGRLSPLSSPLQVSDGETDSPRASSPSTPATEEEQPAIDENTAEETLSSTSSPVTLDLFQDLSDDTIALRTRSKLPLTDTPLESIEAAFVAPDITTDMYDSECDDDDWKNFLQEFVHPTPATSLNDTADDEAEDPEYNFLEEEEEMDSEDLRDDRAVKISKKEITELMVELFEAADTELADGEEDDGSSNTVCHTSADQAIETAKLALSAVKSKDKNTSSSQDDARLLFNDEHRQLLEDQMRKHVQLLTQGFILSSAVPECTDLAGAYKALLIELQAIAIMRTISSQHKSSFNAYNLIDAVQLVTTYEEKPDEETLKRKPRKKSLVASGLGISMKAMETFMNNTTFIYPELLPDCGFSVCNGKKLGFYEPEDALLAMGLHQFKPLLKEFSLPHLIRQHMLPCKTDLQINIRIKNLRSQKSGDNPVKFLYQHDKLPPFPQQSCVNFDPKNVKKPMDQPLNLLPKWLVNRVRSIHGLQLQPLPIRPYVLAPVPTTTQSFITTCAPAVEAKIITKSPLQIQCPLRRTASHNVRNTETTAVNRNLDSIIYVPSTMPNQVATVSVLNLQSATRSGPLLTNIKTVLKTPDKTIATATINRAIPLSVSPTISKRISPLKQVSPILKKYSPKRMRKTGGNLSSAPLILPKLPRAIYLSPLKKGSSRLLAPKPLVLSVEQSFHLTASECSTSVQQVNTPKIAETKLEDKDGSNEEVHYSRMPEEPSTDSQVKDEIVMMHEEDLLSPPVIELDSQSDPELFEDDEEPVDNAEDLAALMAASTTIQTTPRGRQHLIARKSTRQKDIESTLQLLSPDLLRSDPLKEDRETIFAQAYLNKVKEATKDKPHVYEEFLKLLYDFGQSDKPVSQLHRDVSKVLKNYPVLCDHFVAFLLPEQAMECGKLMEFLEIRKMRLFCRKLEVHFTKHPQHVQKLIRALAQCHQQTDVSINEIKNVMQPLFRGQAHLMEEFLHLFPSEKIPESYMTDFEEIILPDSDVEIDEDGYELITLPDEETDYGGKKCKCDCHNTQGPQFVSRVRHCVSCGIKIINGRIYIQTGKTLKPAQVKYFNSEDKQYVLQQQQQRAAQSSPKSIPLLSPTINCLSDHDIVVAQTEPHSPSSQCSESSSVSSLSPTEIKDVEDEKEGSVEQQVKTNTGLSTHPLLEALEHFNSDTATTNVQLASDTVTEDAILTPDTSQASSHIPQDFSVLRLVLGNQNLQKSDGNTLQVSLERETTTATQNSVEQGQMIQSTVQATNVNLTSLQLSSVLPNVVLPSSNSKPLYTASAKNSGRLSRSASNYRKTENLESSYTGISHQTSSSRTPFKARTDLTVTSPVDVPISSATTEDIVSPTTDCSEVILRPPRSFGSPSAGIQEGASSASSLETSLSAKNHSVDEHGEVVVLWTRDADRLILQTCQKEGATKDVFEKLSRELKNKSVIEVTQRFSELISLFSEHQHDSSSSDASDADGR